MILNIGSGDKLLKDAVNIDIRVLPGALMMDARSLEFGNATFNEVICHDVIEHFTVQDAKEVLNEINRILIQGGTAEFRLPDLDGIIKEYQQGASAEKVSWWIFGGQDYAENNHLAIYSKDSFEVLLKNAGFVLLAHVQQGSNMVIIAKKIKEGQ